MTIAIISFSRHFPAAGGELHAFECLRRWLLNTTSEFYVVQDPTSDCTLFLAGSESARLHTRLRHRYGGNSFLKAVANLQASLRTPDRVDVAVSVTQYIFDLLPALLIANRNGSKLVLYLHHLFPSPLRNRRTFPQAVALWFTQAIVLFLARSRADLIFTPLTRFREVRPWIGDAKLAPLRNGVTEGAYPRSAACPAKYHGCFIGRISKEKGIDDLPAIWSGVVRAFPDATLAIIGPEIEIASRRSASQLRRIVLEQGLQSNVRFLGNLEDRAKFDALRKSACFVFPSYEEGWGIAITEALASGVPVVAYDLPAYEPFRDAIITVPPGDTARFSAGIVDLLQDNELRAELAAKGLRVARRFDWESIAEEEWSAISATCNTDRT